MNYGCNTASRNTTIVFYRSLIVFQLTTLRPYSGLPRFASAFSLRKLKPKIEIFGFVGNLFIGRRNRPLIMGAKIRCVTTSAWFVLHSGSIGGNSSLL